MTNAKLEALTMEIVKQYYEGDPSFFFKYAHPNAVVLSVGKGQVIEGREAIIKNFTEQRENPIRCKVLSMTCQSYPFTKGTLYVVLQMDMSAYSPNGVVTNVNRRLTAHWKEINKREAENAGVAEGWLFLDAHLSAAPETKAPPTIFTHVSEQILYETMGQMQQETKSSFRDVTGMTHYISASQIVRIQGERQYARVFLLNGESIRLHKRLSEMEQELGESFLRIHNSHLVNWRYIKEFRNYKVMMKDGTVLPASRSCFSATKEAFEVQKKGG